MLNDPVEVMARAIAPLAWAALGAGDTLAHENRRKASLRHAAAAINALKAEGLVIVPDGNALDNFAPVKWSGVDPHFVPGCECDRCAGARLVHARRAMLAAHEAGNGK